MVKTVYYITPSSFCFGVKRSIDMLTQIIQTHQGEKIYCIHALVHNPKVTKQFQSQGITFVESLDDVPAEGIVVFSAHGINRVILEEARKKYKAIYNLECPFVSKIYAEADAFLEQGTKNFFYIGKENHQEGKNVIEYIKSKGGNCYVFEKTSDMPNILPSTILAVLSQTTLNFEHVQNIFSDIKTKYPNANLPIMSDVCKATYERQTVILQHIDDFDTFVVIGGKESNNTKELYNIGINNNKSTFYGESLDDILAYPEAELFANDKVAITGGASTPAEDIRSVFDYFVNKGYTPQILKLDFMASDELVL